MSKERELLKRWFGEFGKIHADIKLLRDTQALLTQPEQTEQEPVAWLITATSCGNAQDWKFVSLERKAPERLERMFPVFTPLYTAPPKREPLSVEAVGELLIYLRSPSLMDLVRTIEKAHGIGGGE